MLEALAASLKTLLYASVLIYSGVIVAAVSLHVPVDLEAFALRASKRAAILAIPVAALMVAVLILRLGGFDETTYAAVFSSSTGASLFMLLAGITLLLTLGDDESSRGVRMLAATLAPGSLAFSSHAAAVGPFQAIMAFAHVTAAAWWIGSLLLLRESCKTNAPKELANVLQRFSALATQTVGGLIVAGLLLIYVLVEFETLPAFSDYEKSLAIKLAIVGIPLALAVYNKFRLTPRILSGDVNAVISLRRMIELELAAIGAVLIATAILTTYTSPH